MESSISNYGRGPPLHLIFFSILSPSNTPIFLQSYSGKQDELRYWHLSRGALDTVEERESIPNRPADCFLGLLFNMDDLAIYGYRSASGILIIVGLGLINLDGVIKDSDVMTIFRAIHQLYSQVAANPFRSLERSLSSPSSENETFQNSQKMRRGAEQLGRLLDGGRGQQQ